MAAKSETLDALHAALAAELARKIASGEASAADLSVAAKFLKDNGIQAVATPGSAMDTLRRAAALPVFPDDDDEEEVARV